MWKKRLTLSSEKDAETACMNIYDGFKSLFNKNADCVQMEEGYLRVIFLCPRYATIHSIFGIHHVYT